MSMSFRRSVASGFAGRLEDRQYMNWVKTLPCVGCDRPADDPHHVTHVVSKGMGTKVSDYLTIPLCRNCHDAVHHDRPGWEEVNGEQAHHALMTLLQALYEGRLRFAAS